MRDCYYTPRLYTESYSAIDAITVNRGERLTVWIVADECHTSNGETEFYAEEGHPVRLQISVGLDGKIRIRSRIGTIENDSFKTKYIEYRCRQ